MYFCLIIWKIRTNVFNWILSYERFHYYPSSSTCVWSKTSCQRFFFHQKICVSWKRFVFSTKPSAKWFLIEKSIQEKDQSQTKIKLSSIVNHFELHVVSGKTVSNACEEQNIRWPGEMSIIIEPSGNRATLERFFFFPRFHSCVAQRARVPGDV